LSLSHVRQRAFLPVFCPLKGFLPALRRLFLARGRGPAQFLKKPASPILRVACALGGFGNFAAEFAPVRAKAALSAELGKDGG